MFGARIELFRLFGIPIRLDVSWFIVAGLVVWSLATGAFPSLHPGLTPATYWAMAAAGTLGLFASIVVHEFFHAMVARRNRIPMRGITLFIFGGVAEMGAEPTSARAELGMAAAGPLASIAIALLGFWISGLARGFWPAPIVAVIRYLAVLNGVLAAFNLLPAFPLDGGRIFRAALWKWKGNLAWATRIASRTGSGFSLALMAAGTVAVLRGNLVGGMWWILIGLFLRRASTVSYQQVLLRQALEGEPVRRFMTADPVTVSPGVLLSELVEAYIYRYHHQLFPVVEDGRLVGCVTTRHVKGVPREEWPRRTVGSLAESCGPDNTIRPGADALEAIAVMKRTGQPRLMVVEDRRLVGVVTLKDLLEFFALKLELEGA
ncbi:MAG TPA: site-2 protease family protein [Gemmatimonadales bacterium]|nr:site-2 protease family protein [Gemmatimonadales bacterium]